MPFFRLTSGVCSFGFIVALAACSEGDQGTGRLTQMRCLQDGLCVEKVGTRSLEIGYRQGDDEVRADIIYRRYGRQVESNRPFSVRFLDQDGKAFIVANSGDNPDKWVEDKVVFQRNVPRSVQESKAAADTRDLLLQKLLDAMQEQSRPDDVDEEAWQEAKDSAKDFLDHLTLPAGRGQGPRVGGSGVGQSTSGISAKLVAQEIETGFSDTNVFDDSEGDLDEDEDEDARDEIDAHVQASEWPQQENSLAEVARNSLGASKMARFGSVSGLKKRNIDYVERYVDPNFEYTQELELWNLNTKTFFVAGWSSKKHHSSAKIWVYRRPVGSTEPWREEAFALTRNHGSRPGDKRMHAYARCTGLPITSGYYNWKGECDGVWLTGHLCNDDTAYQVWHAYGGWNGGRHCVGKKRTKRPSCDKPW